MFLPVWNWQEGEAWPLTEPLAPASCLWFYFSFSLFLDSEYFLICALKITSTWNNVSHSVLRILMNRRLDSEGTSVENTNKITHQFSPPHLSTWVWPGVQTWAMLAAVMGYNCSLWLWQRVGCVVTLCDDRSIPISCGPTQLGAQGRARVLTVATTQHQGPHS